MINTVASKTHQLSLSELQCIELANVHACVPKELALNICVNHLSDSNNLGAVNVLNLWLNKLLRAYICDASDCCDIFKCMSKWVQSLEANLSLEDETALSDFSTLLLNTLDFATWAKNDFLKSDENSVHTAAHFLLSVVHCFLQLDSQCSNECDANQLKAQQATAIDLHLCVLSLLQEIAKTPAEEHAELTPVIQQLIEIYNLLCQKTKHTLTFIKTSQTMTYICTLYYKSDQLSSQEKPYNPDWLKETILHLCDTVLNHIETIYMEDTLTVPVSKIEDYLKITKSYIVMLHSLFSTGINFVDEPIAESLLSLFMGGDSKPVHDLGKDIPLLLSKYVRPYTMQLFELIYKLNGFQQYLIGCLHDSECVDENYSAVCLDCITVAIIDDSKLTPATCQTIANIFDFLLKDEQHFIDGAYYDCIIEKFGILLHLGGTVELCYFFCAGIFDANIIKAQACADVLLFSYRLAEENQSWTTATAAKATQYWIACNNSYAMCSSNASQCQVRRMLKYFHRLNPLELQPFSLATYRLTYCVSPQGVNVCQLVRRLQQISRESLTRAQDYYEMVALFELLALEDIKHRELDLTYFQRVISISKKFLHLSNYTLFADAFLKLAHQLMDLPAKLCILKQLSSSSIQSLYFYKLLIACKFSNSLELTSLVETTRGQQNEAFTLAAAMIGGRQLSAVTAGEVTIYNKMCYSRLKKHICSSIRGPSLKRKRNENMPRSILLQSIWDMSIQLSMYEQSLNAEDIKKLNDIIASLMRLKQ